MSLEAINSLSKYKTIHFIPCSNNPKLKRRAMKVLPIEDLKKYIEAYEFLMDHFYYSIWVSGCIESNKAFITHLNIEDDLEDDEW